VRVLVPSAGARLAVCQGPGGRRTPSRHPLSVHGSDARAPLLDAATPRCSAARARRRAPHRQRSHSMWYTSLLCRQKKRYDRSSADTCARARARQPAARPPSPLGGRLPRGCATAVATSLPPVPAVAHGPRTSERLLPQWRLARRPPRPRRPHPGPRRAARGGRTLGIARTLARLSGSGWSRRVRRSLPRSRWPPRPRDSSLFTARWPVPPPADVPTRPAAYSSCATLPRLTQRQSRPGALMEAGARRAPLTDPGPPVPGGGHVRGQATRPEHVACCKQC